MTAALRLDARSLLPIAPHLELAEHTAQAALDGCGLWRGGAIDEVTQALGFRIVDLPVGGPSRGLSWPGTGVVMVPGGLIEGRRAFAVAHEVGHCYLHGRVGSELMEEACDRFASALLMPSAAFRHTVGQLGANLLELRQRWPWVSGDAIARRIVELYPGTAAGKLESGKWVWRVGPDEAEPVMRQAAGQAHGARPVAAFVPSPTWTAAAWRVSEWPQRALVLARCFVDP